jgi:hypothetical protein
VASIELARQPGPHLGRLAKHDAEQVINVAKVLERGLP